MLDPYKMVVVNVIASILVCGGLLIYRYYYPKKKINLFFVLLLFSLLACISIFRKGVYESGDFTIHIYRSIEFYRSLQEGNILPSWAGGLNAGYGYPLFIFNYPLPYFVISFFHFIGFSFIASMKLFFISNFLFSGIFMYFASKRLFNNTTAAFVAAVFYQFVPYHLIDIHFKNVIGEIMIFTFLPATFFCLQKFWQERKAVWFVLSTLSVALLILSHVVLGLFGMVLFFAYGIFLWLQKKDSIYVIATFFIYLLASFSTMFVWLTPFFLTKYTLFSQADNFVYFPQILELLYSPWRMGFLFQGSKGELSFLIGYTQLFIVVSLLFLFYKKRIIPKQTSAIIFWLFILALLIFFITPYSKFLWGTFSFLKVTGSHRLLVIVAFVTSLLAGYFSLHILKRKVLLSTIIAITIFSTILNWGHRKVIPEITEQHLINRVWLSTATGEGHFYANSKWRNMKDPWFSKKPTQHVAITKGSGEIKEYSRNTTEHIYLVYAKTPINLTENTLYFPGWSATDNTKLVTIKPNKEGLISFNLPKGNHLIKLTYTDIDIYQIVKKISVITFFGLLGILLIISIKPINKLGKKFRIF